MGAKTDSTGNSKLEVLAAEVEKLDEKLQSFGNIPNNELDPIISELEVIKLKLNSGKDSLLSAEIKAEILDCVASMRSKVADSIKAHRDIHPTVSKFGKLVDKSFTDDLSHLAIFFAGSDKKTGKSAACLSAPSDSTTSPLYKDLNATYSSEDLLRLVIIEHLLRQGHYLVALELIKNYGFTRENVGFDSFQELGNLVSAVKIGDLEPAKKWLAMNADHLGTKARHLEYVLTKLDFLATMQHSAHDPALVLQNARRLVPFANDYPADFEHLMGSLVFLGRSLEGTPYADLAITPVRQTDPDLPASGDVPMKLEIPGGSSSQDPDPDTPMAETEPMEAPAKDTSLFHTASGRDALARAANLFSAVFCRQLGLSDIDPLRTAFSSGCRTLARLHSLQRAIACLSKYSTLDAGTLPVAVPLDPAAHRHNIFHCPVIKEVATATNVPVRLTCGHAISRDAFNSLTSADRSKVKCPYCPVDTYKNQALDLIF